MASTDSTPVTKSSSSIFVAIDMGTNSFKMLIVRAYPNGKFFTIDHLKDPIVLGRDDTPASSPFTLSTDSTSRSIEALQKFQRVLEYHKVSNKIPHTRCVATSAVREAVNKSEFVELVKEKTGLEVEVLSGEEEARLVYLGMLQFLPISEKQVLGVDIGGGSTEFVIGKRGNVIFSDSLRLGHVILTQRFGKNAEEVVRMREYIRLVIQTSGLIENVKNCGFKVAAGSSGTIREIEKAIFVGHLDARKNFDNLQVPGEWKRGWSLSIREWRIVVERLCSEGEEEKKWRDGFFKRRSEFIVAGAVLLEEIFEALGIEEMEVSGYALAEGAVADSLGKAYNVCDYNVNSRWQFVVQLAARFNSRKRMIDAAQCAGIAREILEVLRKYDGPDNQDAASLDDKDLEYLEAACMLHNIGLFTGRKGFHKQSCLIIMNSNCLHGYNTEEVKLIALLARHSRKKLPNFDNASFKELSMEVKKKFRFLCAIIRVSVAMRQDKCLNLLETQYSGSHEGLKLLCRGLNDQTLLLSTMQPLARISGEDLRKELEHFQMVFYPDLYAKA